MAELSINCVRRACTYQEIKASLRGNYISRNLTERATTVQIPKDGRTREVRKCLYLGD